MGYKISILLGLFSLQILLRVSVGHSHEGKLGDIEFSCANGEYFTGGYCISVIDVPMIWSEADRTCRRQGLYLMWVDDADEYKSVDHLARSSWEYYWTGLNRHGDVANNTAHWSNADKEEVNLESGLWENGQPNLNDGKCGIAKKNGKGLLGNCLRKLPFVCKTEAVLKGYFRCRNGRGIQMKFKCDGHNDCHDNSDEGDCSSTGICANLINAQYAVDATKPSGMIISNTFYSNKRTCSWSIVTNIGSTIRVKVEQFRTEKSADVMDFRTGGMAGEIVLGELTGNVSPLPTFYSSDNVFQMRFLTDSTIFQSNLHPGFRISWTTDVPQVFNDLQMLPATDTVKNLKSPLYDTDYLPHEKVFEWVITASSDNVVTLQFENIDIDDKGKLYLWDGDDVTLTPTLTLNTVPTQDIFISRSKSVRLMLMSGSDSFTFSKGIYIKYWQGCNVNIMANKGYIYSPGYTSGRYPDNVDCTWIIQREATESRALSLKFLTFQVQPESDYLKIYNDTGDDSPLHSGNGFNGSDPVTDMTISSETGYIRVMFTTNYVLTSMGFSAQFSLDCPQLTVSSQTQVMYTKERVFGSITTLTCDNGYSFVQEEFHQQSSVSMECQYGGDWDKSRLPNCMINYCPIPPSVANGYIIQSSGVKYGGNVTYKCNDGFTILGTEHINCKSDGTWEVDPTCNAEGCSAVGDLENGAHSILEGNGVDFASVVQYECDPGYETYGNITKYCKTGGMWSHTPPTCEKIFCPVPMFQHGSVSQVQGVVYEMTITLTCADGFGINGSSTVETQILKCESDRKFTPFVSCMDVNECNLTSPICPASEDCHNAMGSHMCTCKPGYERLSTDAECTDINECTPNGGRGPCDQKCTNTPAAGYTCSCDMPRYILYTGDGFNNISLAKGETGMRDGDVYLIDHTCVRNQCQVPAPITNGMVLSKKDLFYYNDVIQFTCNHGYLLSGSTVTNTRCSENGTWADAIPTCTRATCTTPTMITIPRSVNIYPGESTSVPYGEVVHIECQYGSNRINRTLYCSYKGNGMYSLQGDSAECPEINCGMPEKPPGSVYTGLTNTSLGDTFTFGCDVGFSMTGMSVDGTDNVTCQENGRWNIGNLTCTGSRCTDPGTPGGAEQIVESYEVGKLLSFKCDNNGYLPEPSEPWQCIVDTATNNNTVKWNTTDLPECMDKTPPVFTNCPGSPIYIEKTEEYSYPDPVATDNSNAVKLILNPGGYRPTGLRSNSDIKILYIAEDFSNNKANCEIEIKIKENIKPTLHCPAQSEIVLISKAEGKSVNMSDYINVTSNGNYNVTFSPAKFVTFNYSTIGVLKKINVTAEGPWGAEDRCSFLVGTKADACFRESFPTSVANGNIVCTSGNISCTVTCKSGYVFNDGNVTKIYDCHTTNVWTPALPVDTCIKYDEPSYIINLQVVYKSVAVASLCVNGHKQMLINNTQIFTQKISSICNSVTVNVGEVEITKMESTTSSFSYITVFEIKLLDPTTDAAHQEICRLILGSQAATKSTFLQYNSSVSCDDSGSTQVNRDPTSVKNKLISFGNLCTAGVQKGTGDGEKCVPCPPGTFSSAAGDTCTECPDGEFQDGFGQTTCKSCPASLPVPSADKKTCVGVCPTGFFSKTGLPPCEACPENYYWVNETHCQMCPNSGSTLGVNAVEDKDGCKLPCDKGKYSLFGYTPCNDCPVNHYQDATKQGSCKPCSSNEITQGTGATSPAQCISLVWTPSNSGTACCDACPENDNTCCQANCSQEISSRTCENRCNDGYIETAACQCTSQCIADGNCCPDYTWKCVDQTITCDTTNCTDHGTCKYKNHKRFCECNTGYKGDNCEIELDPCDSNPCWNGGTCNKTGIDSYNCSCPVDTSCKMVRQYNKIGTDAEWQKSGISPFRSANSTIEYCEESCLKNQRCIALHYTTNFCFIYYEISIIEDNDNSVISEKKCSNTPLFGCDRCEDDLVNSCEADTCSEHGMCQNLVSQNKATCLCPTTGVYTGDRCEQDIDLCSNPNPCQNDGKCNSYGSVRYQCICPDGYTGKNCETNIDECGISPDGCLNNGTCNDGVNEYMCTCVTGFSGDRCKDVPDFCEKQDPCPTGICYNNYDTFDYMCKCEDPYRKDNSGTCEMIPNCETDNCINGTCDSSDGECDCVKGFEGSLCQHNIDDCANMPCQHSGTCTDELNGYECQCPTGYDGKNCENDIDDCVGMCTDNAVGCVDRLNDYTCRCKPGYMGRNCTEDIDECLSYPCEHSGTCENQEDDFTCNCTEGWTGKTCDTPVEFCDPSPCGHGGICYNLTDGYFCKCQKGTTGDTCENFPEVCSIITPCINSGTCNDTSGTAKCTCSDNYDGSSCQLINDQCNDISTCKNSGTCITKDMGYTCNCEDGYSGDNCLTYTDPCSSGPCHSTSACKSEETRYMCYCTHGEVLTDTGCKGIDDNFDIFVDSMIPDAHAFLRNPLVMMPNSSLTIMFWTRVIKTTEENFTLLALEPAAIGTILPVYNPFLWIVTIKNNEFILNSFVAQETIPFDVDVADGKWHFIALSWELTGHTRIFIDAIKIVDKMSVGADALPETLQVILGLGAYGRISKLNIYKEALSNNEMIRAYENYTHLPFDQLVQGWSNIVLSDSVTRIFPSSVGNEDICDIGIKQGCPTGEDRTNPTVECPADQYKTGTSRLTSLTGLKAEGKYSADVTNKSYSIHTDEVYTYGSTNEVLVGYDEDRNYGICRFKVYVKYNADCPAPKTDSNVIYCSGSSGNICDLECPTGLIPSMIHPATYSCGQLGLYDNNRPNKNFVLPTCGEERNQALALTVKMTYKLLINCQEAAANAIREDVVSMITGVVAAEWPDLCKSCTPIVISKCQSGKFLDVEFTITNLGTITNKDGVTYKMREAILIVILQENRFHFPDIASSQLQGDTVIVLENPSCPTGYVVLGDTCVQCGKGTYRNDTIMSCQFCPVGKYQENRGAMSCTDCQSGKTTQTFGSYSSSDCKGDCPVGQYYNDSNLRCEDCERHYYQDMTGQDYCLPCPLGRKTSSKGSNSSSSCYVDCLAGTELQADGSCKKCERGYYRSQADDNCLSCVPGMTTNGLGAETSTDCNIRICYAGNFRNATSNDCQPCPVGEYQSEDLQDSCEECPTDHTTDGEGKIHKNNCTFYCPPGREVLSAKSKTCRLCSRGTYRSNNENEILEPCQNCTAGNTTETTERTRADECSIQKCEAGQKLDNTGACEDCQVDSYQEEELPDSNTQCMPCTVGKGTMNPKSTKQDQCVVICSEGEQNDGTSCSPCPQGTWSNGNMTMRFKQCYNCTQDYTTVGMRSTHPDNCTLRDCDPGYYISGSSCLPCGFGQYQPNRHQEMCLNCSTNQNTSTIASTSQSDCQIYCPKGQEGNVSCAMCQVNYYKPVAGISACLACAGNYTANADRDACSKIYCDRGFYNDNDNCTACPVGTYKDVRGNANSCTACDDGFNTSSVASYAKTDCSVLYCVSGKFENTTSNQCEFCPMKTYKPTTGNEACTDCISNKTTSGMGSTSASDCSVEYCDPGEKRTTSNTCVKCTVGSYQPDSGKDTCIPCASGYTTAKPGEKSESDCFQICPVGFQFNSVNKICVGCMLGYYKDVEGNSVNCASCPVNKTTDSVNSTSVHACSIDDCQPGYRRKAGGCAECEKGKYQTEKSQPSCIDCLSTETTESTRSTKQEQCIKKCDDGMEYNYGTVACDNCPQGFRTIRPTTERCVQCPSGQTTSHAGDNICFVNLVTTPIPPPLTTMYLVLVFDIEFDCQHSDTIDNFKGLVRNKVIAQLRVLAAFYPLLCSSTTSCTNINSLVVIIGACVLAPAGRRRAATNNRITFSVQVPDIPSVVRNNQSGSSRPTRSVLQEDLTVNRDQYNPVPSIFKSVSAIVGDPTIQCPAGSVYNSVTNKCDECPTGTMYDSNTKQCENCTKNTYQSSTGQTTCTACSGTVKKYTLAVGSKKSSDCVSDCVLTPTYCNTGTCKEDQHSVYCTCPDNFEGVRCQTKKVTESKTSAIIGGAIGGGVSLLILILIIIIVCSKLRSRNKSDYGSDSKKFSCNYDGDSDAPYRNPIYHNRAYQGPLPITYPSSGEWSNDGYHHDPYAQYRYPNMRNGDSENEAFYTSFRGSTGGNQHEWNAA